MLDDQEFCQLLHHLGLSWKGYRRVRKGVKKRVRRHMGLLGCKDVTSYLLKMDEEKEVRQECEWLMTVSISRFFRDQRLWEVLRKKILPKLLEGHRGKTRIWSAGCASGEEIYSLKIVCDGLTGSPYRHRGLEITATDMNPIYLQRAREGVYPSSSLKEVPESARSRYFIAQGHKELYAVRTFLKRGIVWKKHNLLSDPPPGSCFHMIFLRNNLLTYYQDDLKKEPLGKVLICLSRDGFLIIGSHEELPLDRHELLPFGPLSYVYQKQR